MLRVLVVMAMVTSIADGAPLDLRKCAEDAVAALPEAERAQWAPLLEDRPLPGVVDREEQNAMGAFDQLNALAAVVALAVQDRDMPRAQRLIKQMEAYAAAQPAADPVAAVDREATLARSNLVAGQPRQARAHLDAAVAALAKVEASRAAFAHHQLLFAAVALGDDALADTEMTACLAALRNPGPLTDESLASMAHALARVGDVRRALRLVDMAGPDRDRVLAEIIAGITLGPETVRKDTSLALEVLGKISSLQQRIFALEPLANTTPPRVKRTKPFVAAVEATLAIEPRATVDDVMRRVLVEVAVDAGLAPAARAVASRIKTPGTRARAEAMIAEGLAVFDKRAAIALARKVIEKTKARGARRDVYEQADLDRARPTACGALTRAGAVDEARRHCPNISPLDILVSLRARPAELAAWWKRAAPSDRAYVLIYAVDGHLPVDDLSFFQELCK